MTIRAFGSTTKVRARDQVPAPLWVHRAAAHAARENGEHPFRAILVGPDGAVLLKQPNAYNAEGRDMTAYAERMLADWPDLAATR